MKIVIIAPGFTELPPKGWGAVESIVWDYYENLKNRNIDIHIVNNSNINIIIKECNELDSDIIHIMYDDYITVLPSLNCKNIIYTSHYAYITNNHFHNNNHGYFNNIFLNVIQNQNCVINAISEEIKNVYIKNGFKSKINIIHNGARDDKFVFKKYPDYPNKSIYVAKIEYRKCQYKYQSIQNIDFVGNYHNSNFNIENTNYLGEWTKETLYNNLTNYSNLILLSDGEADPLVVKEALLAGLGVVVSECSSANLDLDKKFITVIPDDKLNDLSFVAEQIKKNIIICNESREEIREYALEKFSWSKIIDKYILQIKEDFNL
jgi:glycosyltransferase involved in cell wall biosynthesis